MDDLEYKYLRRMILKFVDIDIDLYKSKQMRRRLGYLVDGSKAGSVVAFCNRLEDDPELVRKLKDFLTINVSEFFRDNQHFTNLKTVILPELLRGSPRLNIWSAGCSNGAEVYSIAMILDELAPRRRHRFLATDIDESILDLARKGGPYTSRETRNAEKWHAQRYFRTTPEGYWVIDDLRKKVQFREHNLLQDPFESGFDLIVCRNVIIYFTSDVRHKLFASFQQSLRSGGVLFVGGSEVIIGDNGLGLTDVLPCFYRKGDSATSRTKLRESGARPRL